MNQYTNNTITLKELEQNFINKLFEKDITLKYVSGYIHSEKPVLLECKVCGYRFKRIANCVRKGHPLSCPMCSNYKRVREKKIKSIINSMVKEQKLYINENKRKKRQEILDTYKYLKQNTIYITRCKKCNNEIYTQDRRKSICNMCVSKVKKNHSNKSLKELYKRDKGICYICGKKCDYEDYIYKGDTFIAGNYYPSIDHVIPLKRGGTDDWENLRLAHRLCNSLKRDKRLD